MRLPPALLVCTAGLVTFGLTQAQTPTARASGTDGIPPLRAAVQSLHITQTAGGTELTGRLVNTGRQPLIYTSVMVIFTDASGAEIGRGDGYLTAGPVGPGQTAGLRAALPRMPASAKVSLRLREAGQSVVVEAPATQLSATQSSASRRTTVR